MSDTVRIFRCNVCFVVQGIGFVIASIAAAGGAVFLLTMAHIGTKPLEVLPLFVFSALFAIFAFFVLIRINDKAPVIEMNDVGILVKDISTAVIPWSGIADAKIWRIKASRYITLRLTPDAFKAVPQKFGNRLFSSRNMVFLASCLDRSPREIMELISSRITAHADPS